MFDMKLASVKAGFFDRKAVLDSLGKAKVKVLNEQGRMVRKAAQNSLVYREGVSPPNRPPHAHKTGFRTRTSRSTGRTRTRRVSYLREFLYYAYDKATQSVVVGPAKLNQVSTGGIPRVLEKGGTSIVSDFDGRRRRVRIRKRPYMEPALEAEAPKFERMWKGSIR